ncbi:MAG: beta-eliminating lyase-related protein, partial [Rikenellaceae bacterium]
MISAISAVNVEHDFAYGDDTVTAKAKDVMNQLFGRSVESFFMFNGTGTNVTILKSITKSYNSILCASTAHINVDECGAPEKHTGCKIISIPTTNGKLTPQQVIPYLTGFGFCHHSQPKVISISQTTELGTVYSAAEIRALADLAHQYNMYLHLDGARIANGVVATGGDVRAITVDAGVDVMSFGGTKNGLMIGEAAVFFNRELAADFEYERKQA